MKKTVWILLASIAGFLVLVLSWLISTNNTLVSLDERINEKKAQVENVYQRRMDLIPNLVNTVKGYAKHESSVFEDVAKARAQVGQVQLKSSEDVQRFDQAQQQLTGALSRLMVVVERYPELKADRHFSELQSQLEGTENRITIERQRFNEATKDYNSYIRRFPQTLIAGMRGFKERNYFAATAGAEIAPKVEF
jgi:LemA protein